MTKQTLQNKYIKFIINDKRMQQGRKKFQHTQGQNISQNSAP